MEANISTRKRGLSTQQANGATKPVERVDDPKTDYKRWRLEDDRGRQTWHYLHSDDELKQWPQTTADKYHMGMDTVSEGRSESCPDVH